MNILIKFAILLLALSSSLVAETAPQKRTLSSILTPLVSGGESTYVPKHSILHTPDSLKSKIGTSLEGKFVKWSSFYLKNTSWLHMQKVTKEQAHGKAQIKPEVVKYYKSLGKIIIAVHGKNPIGVRPGAFEAPEATTSN